MSTLTGVNADEVRLALFVMEKEMQDLFRTTHKYCTGFESDISRLTIAVTSGNRFLDTEKLQWKSNELHACKLKVEQEKGPREKRIEIIRSKLLLVENLKTQSLEDMITITGAPYVIVSIIDQYLEADQFKAVDNRTKLEVVKGIMDSPHVPDRIIVEFVALLPDGLKYDFFARIFKKLELARAEEVLTYHKAAVKAIVERTPIHSEPIWPPLPAAQDYFTANSRVDLVRAALDALIQATPIVP